jgi:hypothetical protein
MKNTAHRGLGALAVILVLGQSSPGGAQGPTASSGEVAAGPETYQPAAPGFQLERFLKLDGQIRLRYEYFDPFSYTAAGVEQADDAVLMRTRLGFLFNLHKKLSARIQIQDSRAWGEEGGGTATSPVGSVTTSIDNIDLHEAYTDLKHLFEDQVGEGTLTLRLGRQELSYGDQRLVSPLDWSNVARAWDAGRLMIALPDVPGKLKVDLFASVIRDVVSLETSGGPGGVSSVDENQGFHGLYAAFQEIRPFADWTRSDDTGGERPIFGVHQWDLYTFYRDLADGAFTAEDGSTGDVEEVTLGTRAGGDLLRTPAGAGFDYTGEVAFQTGQFAGEDEICAYGYALTGGYTLAGKALGTTRVRLGVEYDYGSGDQNPQDGERNTFDPLFPFGHYYQGIQDTFSWKNGQDLAFKLDVYPPKETRIIHGEIQYHVFWLSEEKDGWFNAGLAQIRRDPTGSSGNFVGQELDITMKYALVPPFAVMWLGYAHFFPGEYVDETGSDEERDFVFAQLAVTF